MITFVHLRALLVLALTYTKNPAIMRLTGLTVEHVAWAYLPRRISVQGHEGGCLTADYVDYGAPPLLLDLHDPGTARALMVALALALGFDPGPLALRVSWHPGTTSSGERYWCLSNNTEARTFFEWSQADGDFTAPNVAVEDDDAKALGLAVLHVLPATSSTG